MLNVKQFDRIFLTGDKHGDFFDLVKDADRYGFSDKDLLIILGDVGVNYFGTAFFSRNDNHAKTQLSQLPCTILCVHGNHELPTLIFAEDGARYHINDRDFLVIGGAYSVDKWYRLLRHMRWFQDEQLTLEEQEAIRQNIIDHGRREDIILAHTCPMDHRPLECFLSGIDESTVDTTMEKFLQEITETTEYNQFFCGHWHTDKRDGKIRFLFHDIVMLEDTTEREQ